MMSRTNPEFKAEFARVAKQIKECTERNDHTVALMWAQGFVVGVGGSKVDQADRALLNALFDLQTAMGGITPAMIDMRRDIATRLRQAAFDANFSVDELQAFGLVF
jgi:hypothetical protein